MPITNAEEYYAFVASMPEWENPGYIKNTEIRRRGDVQGGAGLWDLRRWETRLEACGQIRNGKKGARDNYTVNPLKWDRFEASGGRDNSRL